MLPILPNSTEEPLEPVLVADAPGASADAEFRRRKERRARRTRQMWPLTVGVTVITTLVVYLLVQAWLTPAWGGLAAAGVALTLLTAFLEVPQTVDAWRVGAEGERKTARRLDDLVGAGFVILHDRKAPGYCGNIDHLAIGPSGVWAIETKNIPGKVEIQGDSLRVAGRRRDNIVDQAYREATSVQIALGAALSEVGVNVRPVVCLHRGELPFFNKTVRGVRLASGHQLVRLLAGGERVLSEEQVQAVAREADRLLKPAVR